VNDWCSGAFYVAQGTLIGFVAIEPMRIALISKASIPHNQAAPKILQVNAARSALKGREVESRDEVLSVPHRSEV
jgi:hypothetical protein